MQLNLPIAGSDMAACERMDAGLSISMTFNIVSPRDGAAILHVFVILMVCIWCGSLVSGIYTCPCSYYPQRAGGMGRPSFVLPLELKAGAKSAEHWARRAVALLLSLDI